MTTIRKTNLTIDSIWLPFRTRIKFHVFPDSQVGAYSALKYNICFIACFKIKGGRVRKHGHLHPKKPKAQNSGKYAIINLHSISFKAIVNTFSPLVGAEIWAKKGHTDTQDAHRCPRTQKESPESPSLRMELDHALPGRHTVLKAFRDAGKSKYLLGVMESIGIVL